jgi:hypothetical protein
MTRAVLEENLAERGLQREQIAVLLDALSIPGMTDATEGLITFWSSTTRNATVRRLVPLRHSNQHFFGRNV